MYSEIFATTWGIETVVDGFMFGFTATATIVGILIPFMTLILASKLITAYIEKKYDIELGVEVEEE